MTGRRSTRPTLQLRAAPVRSLLRCHCSPLLACFPSSPPIPVRSVVVSGAGKISFLDAFVQRGMNCEVCHLKELEVEVFQVREVLRCILHTIFFHRALGLVRPKDVDFEFLDITYVQCGNAELEKKIEEKVDHFYGWVEKHPNKKGQVLLSFYEVKNKQPSWFTNRVERLCWEQWYINLNVLQPKVHGKSHNSKTALYPGETNQEESSSRHAALEASLREVLFQIIKFVNEKKDHIPPVPNLEGVPFPYEITIPRILYGRWRGRTGSSHHLPSWSNVHMNSLSMSALWIHVYCSVYITELLTDHQGLARFNPWTSP